MNGPRYSVATTQAAMALSREAREAEAEGRMSEGMRLRRRAAKMLVAAHVPARTNVP